MQKGQAEELFQSHNVVKESEDFVTVIPFDRKAARAAVRNEASLKLQTWKHFHALHKPWWAYAI